MGQEIDLMVNYPSKEKCRRTWCYQNRRRSCSCTKVWGGVFDGDRTHGYGGFNYHPRFWQPVIPTFQAHWGLTSAIQSLMSVAQRFYDA